MSSLQQAAEVARAHTSTLGRRSPSSSFFSYRESLNVRELAALTVFEGERWASSLLTGHYFRSTMITWPSKQTHAQLRPAITSRWKEREVASCKEANLFGRVRSRLMAAKWLSICTVDTSSCSCRHSLDGGTCWSPQLISAVEQVGVS